MDKSSKISTKVLNYEKIDKFIFNKKFTIAIIFITEKIFNFF